MSSTFKPITQFNEIEQLRKECSLHSAGTIVLPADQGLPDWQISNGRLFNTKVDYFSIGLYYEEEGRPHLMMEQTETALVMLLKSHQGQAIAYSHIEGISPASPFQPVFFLGKRGFYSSAFGIVWLSRNAANTPFVCRGSKPERLL